MRQLALVVRLMVPAALLAACSGPPAPQLPPRVAAFAKLPDWSGLWEPNVFVGEGIGQSLSAEGLKAGASIMNVTFPFTPEWQAKFDAAKAAQAAAVAADPNHPPAPTLQQLRVAAVHHEHGLAGDLRVACHARGDHDRRHDQRDPPHLHRRAIAPARRRDLADQGRRLGRSLGWRHAGRRHGRDQARCPA